MEADIYNRLERIEHLKPLYKSGDSVFIIGVNDFVGCYGSIESAHLQIQPYIEMWYTVKLAITGALVDYREHNIRLLEKGA